MDITYSPVRYEYREIIEEQIERNVAGKVFYFSDSGAVECVEGRIVKMEDIEGKGMFITLDPEFMIRIDRIITLFGKPGAAHDHYDSFGNVCLDCTGGYPL